MSEGSTRRVAEEAAAAAEEAAAAAMDAAAAARKALEDPDRSNGDGTEEGGSTPPTPGNGESGAQPSAPTRGTDKTSEYGLDEGTL
jgi:hypothetical protein